ncbi:MAG: sterol desaturase family protein [Burkholderiaceae bacterium]
MSEYFSLAQNGLFETLVQPVLFKLGLMEYAEIAFDGTEWFLWGLIEIGCIAVFAKSAERWWPAEKAESSVERRQAIRIDMLYTIFHRLGLFTLLVFFTVVPLFDSLEMLLRSFDIDRPNLESWWPALQNHPLPAFFVYLFLLDGLDYWIHRYQHRSRRWWGLHSLHHSQRHMTVWSDNRNHLLDDAIRDILMAFAALLLGVPPGQFIGLVVVSRLAQSLQHGNLRWHFGRWGGRLLVSPCYHRLHHAMGEGHEGPARGCNFAVLFPVWDWLFGTADWRIRYQPTGISDQMQGAEYGQGFWMQQRLGLQRFLRINRKKSS